MNIWKRYINRVNLNCASPGNAVQDIVYWRNNLFAATIIYLLPFCLIALLPSLYWIITTGQYILVVVDVLTVISMLVVAFIPGISIPLRKVIFVTCIYLFCFTMLYYVGMPGPGFIYLQTASIFCILIFSVKYAFSSAFLNTFICILFALAIYYKLVPWAGQPDAVGVWITVSSNLVFLSFLSAALIPRLFNGLQQTIESEKRLRQQLSYEQQSLRHALEMLKQKNEDLEQFAYAASHDLQEPLRMVTSFLTLLEKKYDPVIDDKGKKYIHFAVDGAKRMHQLIADLLAFSRAGRTEEKLEDVDLNELVNEAQILFRNQIAEKHAIIHVDKLPVIRAYKSPLKQVFQNLLANALKYSRDGHNVQINISAKETGTHWEFAIADNGMGIEEEYFDKIFIIFQRLHSREMYPGTGIGLAICKKIVENMGGKIWVKSAAARLPALMTNRSDEDDQMSNRSDGDDPVGRSKGSTFYFTIKKQ
ncbi:MAG: ATP-binding protein [Ferruginibacter sp.]